MDLNIIDIVILIVVLATAVWGGFKGFVAPVIAPINSTTPKIEITFVTIFAIIFS